MIEWRRVRLGSVAQGRPYRAGLSVPRRLEKKLPFNLGKQGCSLPALRSIRLIGPYGPLKGLVVLVRLLEVRVLVPGLAMKGVEDFQCTSH